MSHSYRLRRMAKLLHEGAVLAYPTEGVFGLGCDPRNDAAVRRILQIKRRDISLGLILIAARESQLRHYFCDLDESCMTQVRATWPGPVTWVLPARQGISPLISGGRKTIAVRVTDHPDASALCDAFGGALISTSANVSGRKAAITRLGVQRHLGELVDGIVKGSVGTLRGPSEIRDATNKNHLVRKAI